MIVKIVNLIRKEVSEFIEIIIIGYPSSGIGNRIRKYYWYKKYQILDISHIGRGSKITSTDRLSVGKNLVLGENVVIENSNSHGCYIGDFVGIARSSYIRTANHNFDDIDVPWMHQGHLAKKINYKNSVYSIVIEDNVWIGSNAILLSGAHIGIGVIVSAGSVVSSKIPEYSIVSGNPARIIANRKKIAHHKNKIKEH
jgi:acetyltransferase-like isoleucine patch superfamily enzyme